MDIQELKKHEQQIFKPNLGNNIENLCPTMKELIIYPTAFGLTGHSFRSRTISHFCPKAELAAAKEAASSLHTPYGATPKNATTIYDEEEKPDTHKKKAHAEHLITAYF